jgi:hypothetical protein
MNWFLYLSLSSVLLSYICSLRVFRLNKPGNALYIRDRTLNTPECTPDKTDSTLIVLLRYFSYFLLFSFLAESFGIAWPRKLYRFTSFSRSNQWFYTIFHFASYLFYCWFFFRVLKLPRIKRAIRVLAFIYILVAIINFIFIQGPLQLNTFSDLLACFIMVFLSIAYYYQLLNDREVVLLQRDPLFWISTGLLIYHLGSMMGLFLINVMNAISNEKARDILFIIQFSAVVMYINYSIAFLWMRKK